MNPQEYMQIALKQAQKAFDCDEVPVGAVVVNPVDGKIVAKGYNHCEHGGNAFAHAEIEAMRKACRKLKQNRLRDMVLYVTLEPCDMCKMIISEARIDNVYYLIEQGSITNKYSKTIYEQMFDDTSVSYKELFNNFFNKIRNK